jgi:uncharacterized membrane protein YkoI
MKYAGAIGLAILLAGVAGVNPASAGKWGLGHNIYQSGRTLDNSAPIYVQSYGNDEQGDNANQSYGISASEAAAIAKGSWPGAKVLKVQLLPSGVYAVTLKQGGEVSRILVDATSGAIV